MRLVQRRNFAAAGLTCHVPARKLNATTAKALPDIRRRLFCCISAVEKRKKLRRGHYVFIRRHHLGAAGRGAGILHAGGLCDGGDRPDTRQKCGQHHHEKPDGFCPRHRCLLAGRLRHHVRSSWAITAARSRPGRSSFFKRCSAPRRPPSSPARWRSAPSSFLIAFTA